MRAGRWLLTLFLAVTLVLAPAVGARPPTTTVPKVTGIRAALAKHRLAARGLHASVRTAISTRPSGTVLAQSPAPGSHVPRGTAVRLTVATAAPTRTSTRAVVPDVVGQEQDAAEQRLQGAGLSPSAVSVHSLELVGTVVAQDPTAGASVDRGTRVTISISSGPGP